jgi:hypothetical protein
LLLDGGGLGEFHRHQRAHEGEGEGVLFKRRRDRCHGIFFLRVS